MNMKKIGFCLAACLLFFGLGIKAWEIDRPCSVTFENSTFPELNEANVVIDIYRIGNTVPDPNYDTYSFETDRMFDSLGLSDMSTLDNESYTRIASSAMDIVLEQEVEPVKTTSLEQISELSNGLYLAVPHGADLDSYTKQNMRGETYTIAQSPAHEYHFSPVLFSLPTKDKEDGIISTGNGEWKYDTTITLKVEEEPRKGSLEIVKTLERFDDNGPATFVFSIEAYEDETMETLVYSNVESIVMNGSGSESTLLENCIPVGSYVVVREVYSGASYEIVGSDEQITTIRPIGSDHANVAFTNDSNDTDRHGSSVTNRYTYDERQSMNEPQQDFGGR